MILMKNARVLEERILKAKNGEIRLHLCQIDRKGKYVVDITLTKDLSGAYPLSSRNLSERTARKMFDEMIEELEEGYNQITVSIPLTPIDEITLGIADTNLATKSRRISLLKKRYDY